MNRIFIASLLLLQCWDAYAASGKLIDNNNAMYPRAVVAANQPNKANNGKLYADVTSFRGKGIGAVYESTDNGTSWHQVGEVADPAAAGTFCCTTLFELPSAVGALPAGTLLWAGSLGGGANPRRMRINMWASTDLGKTWKFISSPASTAGDGGLWEPEFSMTFDGQLVCHFSDETEQPRYSQLLQEVFSKDGVTWSQKYPTSASTDSSVRPGMANVRKLTSSLWIMTFEVCGGIYGCNVHFRTSNNGENWGDPANLGAVVIANTGHHFQHAPTIDYNPVKNQLSLAGQILVNSNGAAMPNSGRVLFVTNSALSAWTEVPSPVAVGDTRNDPCPNYSSALLYFDEGRKFLQIATDYSGTTCMAYYNVVNA